MQQPRVWIKNGSSVYFGRRLERYEYFVGGGMIAHELQRMFVFSPVAAAAVTTSLALLPCARSIVLLVAVVVVVILIIFTAVVPPPLLVLSICALP